MRTTSSTLLALLLLSVAEEFHLLSTTTCTAFQLSPLTFRSRRVQLAAGPSKDIFEEFGYLLQESDSVSLPQPTSRRSMTIGSAADTADAAAQQKMLVVQQASTMSNNFPGAGPVEEEGDPTDPYAVDEKLARLQQYQQQEGGMTWNDRFQTMDFQDLVITLFVPGVLAFVGGRWLLNRASGRVANNADEALDMFARELMVNDGAMDAMKDVVSSYKTKLVWMGPKRNTAMLQRYLEAYAKQRTVSPQAIASLSTVFQLFGLSEVKAAQVMVDLCETMGTRQMASIGAILFFGSRIFQSVEGKQALEPIKAQIMATYEDDDVGEQFLETAQTSIAEAAYRNAILEGGKKQTSLSSGWQVLGLTKERATQMFQDEKKDGFITDREKMYGGQARQYDKKGRVLDGEGKLENPDEAEDDDEDENMEVSSSNQYECGRCGFTLFIASGRESKFFGTGFKCPECGAPKKEFKPRDDSD